MIVLFSHLLFLFAGAWLTYRAQRGQSPVPLTEWRRGRQDDSPSRREPLGSI